MEMKMSERPEYPQPIWEPCKPERHEFHLHKAGEGKIIYRDLDGNGDIDSDWLEERLEDEFDEGGRPPLPEQRYWEKLSLQDILDLAPPGTRPCDIVLGIDFPRDYYYTDLTFTVYNRDLEAEEDAYQKALEKYKKDKEEYDKALPEYEKKLKALNDWQKEQKIKELQTKIKELEDE